MAGVGEAISAIGAQTVRNKEQLAEHERDLGASAIGSTNGMKRAAAKLSTTNAAKQ
jgi:hypothetical protein